MYQPEQLGILAVVLVGRTVRLERLRLAVPQVLVRPVLHLLVQPLFVLQVPVPAAQHLPVQRLSEPLIPADQIVCLVQ